MKSMTDISRLLAGASFLMALVACDSIKNVPEKPTGTIPTPTAVVGGTIEGLGSLRALTLSNNGDLTNTRSFIANVPTAPGTQIVPFSLGSFPVGSTFNVDIARNVSPFGKLCQVVANKTGTVVAAVPGDDLPQNQVRVVCENRGTRRNLTVGIPNTAGVFAGLPGATVRLITEDQMYEAPAPTPGQNVTFTGALLDATNEQNPATWTVTAFTRQDNVTNKCAVQGPTGSNPIADVPATNTFVGYAPFGTSTVKACEFTIGGQVAYSQPYGGSQPTAVTGLTLELRKLLSGEVQQSVTITNCAPTNTNVTAANSVNTPVYSVPSPKSPNASCAYQFPTAIRSTPTSGSYEVAVGQQPAGQFCIVTNGGAANVFTTGTTSPLSITSLNVFCRATPTQANRQLEGVFRLQSSTWIPNIASPVPVTSTYTLSTAVQNTASSNMIAFFKNGTFLYGTHANGVQVEQGFYDYDPDAHTLRFTLVVDTNTSTTFPATFSPNLTVPVFGGPTIANTQTTTPGISATPNPIRFGLAADSNAFANHYSMTGVTFGTVALGNDDRNPPHPLGNVRTISGRFGADPAGQTLAAGAYGAPNANRLDWVLQEPPSLTGEMTGTWISRDSRRLWNWDFRTYYGLAVGVLGGQPSMNDACFTIEDLHASKGIYTRRGSGLGCYPFARPSAAQVAATPGSASSYSGGASESTDFPAPGGGNGTISTMPEYNGRIPGGNGAAGNASPSPVYYHIAPAASFFSSADPAFFPERYPTANDPATPTNWCSTEILGIRTTSNGLPINYPIYMCRTRFNQ